LGQEKTPYSPSTDKIRDKGKFTVLAKLSGSGGVELRSEELEDEKDKKLF